MRDLMDSEKEAFVEQQYRKLEEKEKFVKLDEVGDDKTW